MATVINNPDSGESTGGGVGLIVGAIILLAIVVLFFVYGLPALRGTDKGTTVNVPEQVQVDVNRDSTGN